LAPPQRRGNTGDMMLWLHGWGIGVGLGVLGALLPTGNMVTIPAGPFVRGDEAGDPDEKPVQRVTVAAFSIDRTEVTVGDYTECVQSKACPALPQRTEKLDAKLPVTGVSWQEATAYCQWQGKRLPSESEWEKAARGSDGRRYPWGNEFACQRGNFGNFAMDGRCAEEGAPGKPVAVGSYPNGASPYGLLDMAGNVWEWTTDTYRADAYRRAEAGVVRGSPTDKLRVLRGGGCCSIFGLPRAADRLALPLDYRDADIGFRCAKDSASSDKRAP
jgi:formylglycine-generating enzyme required for sulfatase activity